MITIIVALLLVEFVVLSSLVYTDHGFWGLFSLAVAAAVYSVFVNQFAVTETLSWIGGNLVQSLLYGLGYVAAGVVWSFFKYYSFIRSGKRNGMSKASLQASSNTSKVITWTAYWPISAVLHVAGDGVYKMFRWVYDQVSGVYDSILTRVYGE